MPFRPLFALAALTVSALGGCHDPASVGSGGSRAQIRVVGSSTVYPFTQVAAEQYLAANPEARAPVIESTGTGAGMKLFCDGVGGPFPDIEDASRRMTAEEYGRCAKNGAGDLLEVQIGIDGIAFAEANGGPKLSLTPAMLYKALAAAPGGRPNPYRRWHDIDPALPPVAIQIYGPPATSGTRDALTELILSPGCEAVDPQAVAIKARAPADYAARCHRIREDGAYIDAGENDNLIVQKLQANPSAIGIFGYSYLEENAGKVHGVPINGVTPTYASIAGGLYPGARPLFLYVKKAHLDAVPGLRTFLSGYVALTGPDGLMVAHGLIAAPAAVRERSAGIVRDARVLDPSTLTQGAG